MVQSPSTSALSSKAALLYRSPELGRRPVCHYLLPYIEATALLGPRLPNNCQSCTDQIRPLPLHARGGSR